MAALPSSNGIVVNGNSQSALLPTTSQPISVQIANQSETIVRQPPILMLPVSLADSSGSDNHIGTATMAKSNVICQSGGPMITEQAPSDPSSPTSPRLKRPSPLTPEALRRIHLLTNGTYGTTTDHLALPPYHDPAKLSPLLSPNSHTSDLGQSLGSSPRSSITGSLLSPGSYLPPGFGQFRDMKKSSSDYTDVDSDLGKDLLSPMSLMLSPAPFSPYSDSAFVDSNSTGEHTGYSPHSSITLSPLGKRSAGDSVSSTGSQGSLHFSFEDTALLMNNNPTSSREQHNHRQHLLHPSGFLAVPTVTTQRMRSQSATDVSADQLRNNDSTTTTSALDGIMQQQQQQSSTNTTTVTVNGQPQQFKKRLMRKYEREQKTNSDTAVGGLNAPGVKREAKSESDTLIPLLAQLGSQGGALVSAAAGLFSNSNPVISEAIGGQRFNLWMQNQIMAWQTHWYGGPGGAHQASSSRHQAPNVNPNVPLISRKQPPPSPSTLNAAGLIPNGRPQPSVRDPTKPATPPFGHSSRLGESCAPGPVKSQGRRSRSESDVPVGSFLCPECGQGFTAQTRLIRHIASRHRDRSVNRRPGALGMLGTSEGGVGTGVDSNSRPHKCTMCPKSFVRSDMLTRHMRLHTGIKPYACQICGQEFSRSDHLSTHQRTHTGEKPYQCPQCSYAASRRDMITRHMRTHSRGGATHAITVPIVNRCTLAGFSNSVSAQQQQQQQPFISPPQHAHTTPLPTALLAAVQQQHQETMKHQVELPTNSEEAVGKLAGSIQSISVKPEPNE